MAIAKILLKNDVGLVLDITESPLGCTVYDLEGNEISGGGGSDILALHVTLVNDATSSGSVDFFGETVGGYMSGYYAIDNAIDSISDNPPELSIAPGESADVTVYYNYGNLPDMAAQLGWNPGTTATVTASDIVNLTYQSEYNTYDVTDGTADSSITVTIKV